MVDVNDVSIGIMDSVDNLNLSNLQMKVQWKVRKAGKILISVSHILFCQYQRDFDYITYYYMGIGALRKLKTVFMFVHPERKIVLT